jgi:hypothetical protein
LIDSSVTEAKKAALNKLSVVKMVVVIRWASRSNVSDAEVSPGVSAGRGVGLDIN